MIGDLDEKFKDLRGGTDEPPGERPRKKPGRKILAIAGGTLAVVLLLYAVYALLYGGGSMSSGERELIKSKLGKIEGDVSRVKNMEERLLNVEKTLLSQAPPSGGVDESAAKQIESLTRRVDALEKKMAAGGKITAQRETAPKQAPHKEAPASASKRQHEVKKGETLYQIAKKYGLTVDQVRKLNNLGPNDGIKPGQKLTVSK